MKVLVTGATGFLGREIARQLAGRGDTVRALVRRADAELQSWGVELALGDVRDAAQVAAACRTMDVVIHAAAVAGIWGPWQRYYSTNTVGTQHVLAGCRQAGVGRLVYTSTPSVTFDGSDDQCLIDERTPYAKRWLCHYPHSKALAEQAVLRANGPDLATCALRPHLIWGPGDRHLVPRLWERARKGQLRRVGDGTNLIDIVFIENAAEAHLLAADRLSAGSAAAGQAYFISQGEAVNCWQWIDELLALAEVPPVTRRISMATAWRIGMALEALWTVARLPGEPRMTRFLAAQLGRSHYFSLRAAESDLGYRPRVSTAEGMQRLRAWLATRAAD